MLYPKVIKPVAMAVAVFVFALTVAGSIASVGHGHHGDTDHSALHASLECIWMCAASSFMGVEDTHLIFSRKGIVIAKVNSPVVLFENLLSNFQPRAPPVFL